MAIDPSIALATKPVEIESPVDQYLKVLQLRQAKNAIDDAEIEHKNRNALLAYLPTIKNYNDPEVINALNTRFGKQGLEFAKSYSDRASAELTRQKVEGDLIDSEMKRSKEMLAGVSTPDQFIAWHEANHSNPILGPWLDKIGATQEKARQRINDSVANGTFPQLLQESALGIDKAREMHYMSQNLGNVERTIQIPKYSTPGVQPSATVVPGSQAPVGLSPNRPQNTTVNNINTKAETAYSTRLNQKVAEQDDILRNAALKSQDNVENAQRILDILGSGKVITGTGAQARLQVAKALNLVGATDSETIANTELLMSSLAKNTLAAVKDAGLGTGQGFTDKDRDFVEKAAAGKIEFSDASLSKLASLAQRSAVRAAEKWNKRFDQIPDSAKVSGIDKVAVPSVKGAPPSLKNDKGWVLHTDKNGNKAYVSPDGKRFESVK